MVDSIQVARLTFNSNDVGLTPGYVIGLCRKPDTFRRRDNFVFIIILPLTHDCPPSQKVNTPMVTYTCLREDVQDGSFPVLLLMQVLTRWRQELHGRTNVMRKICDDKQAPTRTHHTSEKTREDQARVDYHAWRLRKGVDGQTGHGWRQLRQIDFTSTEPSD